ncbi:M20/M25/M40 family metallo-hydrolase [Bradyrhizobium ivorense]|uniref:M20/M25/M40 family metallo-hydrolase n=1 Tax=Bradyrhizobium ivorense TaxID=2511166 RepID=UPI003556A485
MWPPPPCRGGREYHSGVSGDRLRALDLVERVTGELFGEVAWRKLDSPVVGAEDFAYVLQKVPSAIAYLGTPPQGCDFRTCCSLHSKCVVLDEKVMARGVAIHCGLAETFLRDGFARKS